jgi:hypothetical protein
MARESPTYSKSVCYHLNQARTRTVSVLPGSGPALGPVRTEARASVHLYSQHEHQSAHIFYKCVLCYCYTQLALTFIDYNRNFYLTTLSVAQTSVCSCFKASLTMETKLLEQPQIRFDFVFVTSTYIHTYVHTHTHTHTYIHTRPKEQGITEKLSISPRT